MEKKRYFAYRCVSCAAEVVVRAFKEAQSPTCCVAGRRMKYLGIRELSDDEIKALPSTVRLHGALLS